MTEASYLRASNSFGTTVDNNTPRIRTEVAVFTDNIIRQRLRVGDPRDASEVANGLRQLFPAQARLLDAEVAGIPIPMDIGMAPVRVAESMATSAEIERGQTAVERDLASLTADHRLGNVAEELLGWGHSIRSIIADGRTAASVALDPRARDRLFGARRQLSEYARLIRMIGALGPDTGSSYRRLALSLDEIGSSLLVLAGETLAGQSLGGLRFLPSVAASDLQARRDAVLVGLRALNGAVDEAASAGAFPWGLNGLRELLLLLERSGHLDLRALLDEGALGQALDGLVELAARNDGAGLRALGATGDLTTQRLHRLLNLVQDQVQPAAPALSYFLKALQLFLDAFRSSHAGYKLVYVGRPPIALRGLTGLGGPDRGTRRLLNIVSLRGELAQYSDCFLACGCERPDMLRQIMLDKLLHDVDRAIDLYVLGSDTNGAGEPEWRAAAYGSLIAAFLVPQAPVLAPDPRPPIANLPPDLELTLANLFVQLGENKLAVDGAPIPGSAQEFIDAMGAELCLQRLGDARLETVLQTMTSGCLPASDVMEVLDAMTADAVQRATLGAIQNCAEAEIRVPATPPSSLENIADTAELIYQKIP